MLLENLLSVLQLFNHFYPSNIEVNSSNQFMTSKYWILFLFLNYTLTGYTQDADENVKSSTQYWLDYNLEYPLENENTLSGFIGFRSISPHIYNNFLLVSNYNIINRKGLGFLKLEKPFINSFHLGARMNYIANKNLKDDFEFRLMQGFKFFIPLIKELPIMNYVRFEERFQYSFEDGDWTVGYRFRYRVSSAITWENQLLNFGKGFYLPFNVEFFFNLKKSDRFNDVIRLSPGIGYKLNDEWRFELYASYHNALNTTENTNTSNDFVIRLRILRSHKTKERINIDENEEIIDLID